MTLGLILYCAASIIWTPVKCNPITNSHFNEDIRGFAVTDDGFNSSNAKTLLKEDPGLYANFTPIRSPVKFKDHQDNAQSSSSYSRGLVDHHEHPEYTVHEYEGPYDFDHAHHHFPDHGYHHGFDHHSVDHYGHHGHHGDHHYHDHHKYHHGLAAKTALWPIAGLALLGAAAALVTNPILLQIGVASGKRRRRDTEEDIEPNIDINRWSTEDSNDGQEESSENKEMEEEKSKRNIKQRLHLLHKRNGLSYKREKNERIYPTENTKPNPYVRSYSTTSAPGIDNDSIFIPVPIKINDVS